MNSNASAAAESGGLAPGRVPDGNVGEADLARFRDDGFLVFEQLADAATVGALGAAYDQVLTGEVSCAGDRKLGGLVRQIMSPELHHPLFADNKALDAGRAIARQILHVDDPHIGLQMLIYKEPGQTAETPWHQDFAYVGMPFTPAGATVPFDASVMFWLALDDVDTDNGCMHFVPGGHLAPLQSHYVASGDPEDPGRLLAIREPEKALDLTTAVACPLHAGGATMHSFGTPHYTSGNRTTDRRRRAYIFNFTKPEFAKR